MPTVPLGSWPTPLEQIDHPQIGRVLVKRDDLAGFGGEARSGVKARKLEGLLGYMTHQGIKSLVMPLGNVTNLGHDLIRVAAGLEIGIKLLIVDDPPIPQEQREIIFRPVRENVRLLGKSYATAAALLALEKAGALITGNRRMIVLPSPAHPSAIAGAARGYVEAMRQAAQIYGSLPRSVYIAAAAGSTVAGFGLGEALMRAAGAPPVKIIAVKVVSEPLALWLPLFVSWTAKFAGLSLAHKTAVLVVANPRNTIYGRFDQGHVETCARIEQYFGLKLDPIYGGKSWTVMEMLEGNSSSMSDRLPLFWHCGYTPNWQTYSTRFDA
jgi:1-aminocyclopropane-1-carboxylate deaminase/D-cysteine desulfhydrase-like pyridoxal-dependent ACC family enzyme